MRRCGLLLLLAAALPAGAAEAEPGGDVVVSVDPDLTFETGTDLIGSLVALTGRAEARIFRPLDRPAARLPVRTAWAVLFDLPVAWWFGVFLHEAYGHGGRAREFGSSAGFHLGSPWAGREAFASFEATGLTPEELLRIYAGGSEANGWAATLLERRAAAGRHLRPLEWMYLAASRFVVSDYVLRTTPDPGAEPLAFWREWSRGGDVANYLGYQNRQRTGDSGIGPAGASAEIVAQYRRLKRQAWWNALDPGAWLALYTAGRTIVRGEERGSMPLPQLAGRAFLPVFSADWLPEGGAASLELIFGAPRPRRAASRDRMARSRPRTTWFSFVLRRGRGTDGSFHALGAAAETFARTRHLRLGGEVEVWQRPGQRAGGGFRLRIVPREGPLVRLFVDLGAKSAGHWPGRPVEPGPFLRIGARLPL